MVIGNHREIEDQAMPLIAVEGLRMVVTIDRRRVPGLPFGAKPVVELLVADIEALQKLKVRGRRMAWVEMLK